MFNLYYFTKEVLKEHNLIWPYFPHHTYRTLLVWGSRFGKTNALLILINQEPDVAKIYLYAKDPHEEKYQLLINERESTGLTYINDSKTFFEYSNDMDNVYEDIEEYNPNKKRKILIVFDDMIADFLSNKKFNPIVIELFIRRRKLNISLVFIAQSYFGVPKNARLKSTHYFVMKIPNKIELQQIAFNHSLDFQDIKNYIKIFLQNHIRF